MKAIVSSGSGPEIRDVPDPTLRSRGVLVRVSAAALNRVDLLMSRGGKHGASGGVGVPFGMEAAGVVVSVADGVTRWRPGDRVMGMTAGAFAELVVMDERVLFSVPDEIELAQAATLPVGLLTMHDALVTQGQLAAGQTVLVQGASSGMGILGMQIARELGASQVIGTSTTPARLSRLREVGATVALDPSSDNWAEAVRTMTGGGVDVLVDMVAGDLVDQSLSAVRIGGRMVNIGRVGGERVSLDLDQHSFRRINYIGVTSRTKSPDELGRGVSAASALLPAVAAGRIESPLAGRYTFDSALDAFELMGRNGHFGKIVIQLGDVDG